MGTAVQEKTWWTAAELAAEIRTGLKELLPDCKFSVTCENYSMGRSITVALMEAPFDAILGDKVRRYEEGREFYETQVNKNGYAQLNHYTLKDDPERTGYVSNGAVLSPKAWRAMATAVSVANRRNWDRSDIQTDYFDVNFYLHVSIGKWNKPFTKRG
jgi:hypothetical protein